MRWLVILVVACGASATPVKPPTTGPHATSAGTTFVVPPGWTVEDHGAMTVVTPADTKDSHVVLVEATSADPDGARDEAWKLYKPEVHAAPVKTDEQNGRNGWQQTRQYTYEPLGEDRTLVVTVAFANGHWTAAILDVSNAIMNLRTADLSAIFDHLEPK